LITKTGFVLLAFFDATPVRGQSGSAGLVGLADALGDWTALLDPFEQPVSTTAKEIAKTTNVFLRTQTPEWIFN
jgi:hypothetical protein